MCLHLQKWPEAPDEVDAGPQVRTAGCVWLVALASFTGRQRALLGRLGELQEAFSALLGDASETTQEMASRGLSVVYTLGDRGAQEQLLASLMGTLQGAALASGHFPACVWIVLDLYSRGGWHAFACMRLPACFRMCRRVRSWGAR